MGERVGDRRHVPRLVARRDQHLADRVDELRRPTARRSRRRRPRSPAVISARLRRSSAMVMRPGKLLGDLAVDPLQQAPALGERVAVVALVAAHAADVERHVEAQPVEVVLLQPQERVVADELAHLAAAVVGPGVAPGRLAAPVVVEVDAALVVLAPAVELPEVEVARAEVVVDDVEDHRDPALVRGLDERLEALGPAVGALDGEDVGGVVAPGDVAGELRRRHDLHRVHPEPLQVPELARSRRRRSRPSPRRDGGTCRRASRR